MIFDIKVMVVIQPMMVCFEIVVLDLYLHHIDLVGKSFIELVANVDYYLEGLNCC